MLLPAHNCVRDLLTALTAAVLVGCGGSPSIAVFEIRQCGDRFFVKVSNPVQVNRGIQLVGQHSIVGGRLARGDGQVNAPWSWHLDSNTVAFAEAAIEVCDGCPRSVESNLTYWIEDVGAFCPWQAQVVSVAYGASHF